MYFYYFNILAASKQKIKRFPIQHKQKWKVSQLWYIPWISEILRIYSCVSAWLNIKIFISNIDSIYEWALLFVYTRSSTIESVFPMWFAGFWCIFFIDSLITFQYSQTLFSLVWWGEWEKNIFSCESPNAVFTLVLKSKWFSTEEHTVSAEAVVITMPFIVKITTCYQAQQTARQQDTPAHSIYNLVTWIGQGLSPDVSHQKVSDSSIIESRSTPNIYLITLQAII